jgi:MFS transporter, OFA family, oxalate/formate antiporter
MYLLLAVLIGFGFGGNFVLFAKETANMYGVMNLATIYPYVFTGYAIAGIAGPLSGGLAFRLLWKLHICCFTGCYDQF